MQFLTVSGLSELTHISADTLRYYDKMKLIKAAQRSSAGYRLYAPETVNVIRFIRGAKALNFTLEEIKSLLRLKASDTATCSEMVKQTEDKIVEAEQKIMELKEIKKVLTQLVKQCPGGDAPIDACPILDHLTKNADCCSS